MNILARMAKNTIAIGIGRLVSPLFNLILVIYIARVLGNEPFGIYSFTLNYLVIFQSVASLGFAYFIPREVAIRREDANRYLVNGCLIELVSALMFMSCMILVAFALGYPEDTMVAVTVASFALLPSTINVTFEAIYVSFERVEAVALVSLAESALKVALSLALLMNGYGIVAVFIVIVLSRVAATLLHTMIVHRHFFRLRFDLDLAFCRKMVRAALVFGLIDLLAYVFIKIDIVMISKMRGMADVGLYSAAWKILEVFFLIPGSFIAIIIPIYSRIYVRSREHFQGLIEISVRVLWIILFPMALWVFFYAEDLIQLIFGPNYTESILALKILIWSIIPFAADSVLGKALIAGGLQKADVWILAMGTVGNIVLNIYLIPRYGICGASGATGISILLTLLLKNFFLRRTLVSARLVRAGWKPAIGILLMLLLHSVLDHAHAPIQAGCTAAAYVACMWLFKAFSAEDVRFLSELKGLQE